MHGRMGVHIEWKVVVAAYLRIERELGLQRIGPSIYSMGVLGL